MEKKKITVGLIIVLLILSAAFIGAVSLRGCNGGRCEGSDSVCDGQNKIDCERLASAGYDCRWIED